MAAVDRALARGDRRANRILLEIGDEFREARVSLALSQRRDARAVGLSQSWYSRIEAGAAKGLALAELSRVAAVLGLDLSVRTYPGGTGLRDAGQGERLQRLLSNAHPPLAHRSEVPLPAIEGRPEQRSWDAMIFGYGRRIAVEVEMRLRDVQAVERRHHLKRRDDPTDGFLLVVAATRANRRILSEHPGSFADLPRLRPSGVLRELAAGRHPPTGLVFL
jgi:transcriptional regulator with XRE-family HTH domain